MPGIKPFQSSTSSSSSREEESSSTTSESSSETKRVLSMQEAEKEIYRNSNKIIMSYQPSQDEFLQMKKLNRVNCLHRGNFEGCTGKRYMVTVDGTNSANIGFETTLKLLNPSDHLFIVTVRERKISQEFQDEKNRTIITHKLWQAAADIIRIYQERASKTHIDYTSILPEADDAREIVCALVKKYKVDVLVLAKHKGEDKLGYVNHLKKLQVRSFKVYCQR